MSSSLAKCTTRQVTFKGWEGCTLENELIRLVAVPDIGGRIMAYDLGPYAYIYVNQGLVGKTFSYEDHLGDGTLAAWKNYGGEKTWPAPQGWNASDQWQGPPDPVLDSGRYTVKSMGSDGAEASVHMISPPDPRTGLQISREIAITQGSSRVHITIGFTNITNTPIQWSIWDVLQLRAKAIVTDDLAHNANACMMTVPLNPNSKFKNGYTVLFGAEDNPQWQIDSANSLFTAPYQWHIGKAGIDSEAGWIGFNNGPEGYGLTGQFHFEPDGTYPDGGVTTEVWTIGAGRVGNLNYTDPDISHVQAEILSPLYTIQPGETSSFDITWSGSRCTGPILDANDAGCLTQKFTSKRNDDFILLSANGGIFDIGELYLQWQSKSNGVIETTKLMDINPLNAFHLDAVYRPPDGADSVALVVETATGKSHQLAQTDFN